MPTINATFLLPLLLPVALLAGCRNDQPGDHPDPAADAGDPTADASAPAVDVSVTVPRNPLGTACSANSDCTSGFCTDGVCCDSACDQTCYACNQQATMGHCAAQTSGPDPAAGAACTAPSTCFLPPSTSVPVCKFIDGTACERDGDCVSGHCSTYYVDADGDGYGTAQAAHFCAQLNAAPPAGYAAYTGDCCDLDAGANPGFGSTQFLAMPDACGSYDWNCNGQITQEATCSTGMVACGQACVLNFFGPITLFTQACN